MRTDGDPDGGAEAPTELQLSGIDEQTGGPALPPVRVSDLARLALTEPAHPDEEAHQRALAERGARATLGAEAWVDLENLADTGWAVAFGPGVDPAVREALSQLRDLRRSQASASGSDRYLEIDIPDGQTYEDMLIDHGMAASSPANPDQFPYHVLLVGGPDRIPWAFQYGLDSVYSVGRLDLDTPDDYERYAAAVVAAESAPGPANRRALLFAPQHPGDQATELSARSLVGPLADALEAHAVDGWTIERRIGDDATKATLRRALLEAPPAFLLAAGHGLELRLDNARQRQLQGALVCQDWPGPGARVHPVSPDVYLSADDVTGPTGPAGLVALLFACFGAGTPVLDEFGRLDGEPRRIAADPFVAALPRRLLSHPGGPALAVMGHVERAVERSFVWPGVGRQIGAFESVIRELLEGHRVGNAFHSFNDRWLLLANQLLVAREAARSREPTDVSRVAWLWIARNDARNYVVLGDPAVRIPGAATP